MPRRKKVVEETVVKEQPKKRGRKPKVKVALDLANQKEVFGTTPEDKYEPTGKFVEVKTPTKADLDRLVENYEFCNSEDKLLVKYKYHKRSSRYNALRNITNEPIRTMNDEKYKYWINDKVQKYNPYYNLLNYQMESAIPERILELTKNLVVFTKPKDASKKEYELHITRILGYIAKSVIDKYFYDKLPIVNRWIAPEDMEHIDLLTAFNEGVNDFCTFTKIVDGKSQTVRAWDDYGLRLPVLKTKWLTQTDRDFKYRIAKSGDTYRMFLGICLKEGSKGNWNYFNDDHVNAMSDEVDKLAMGKVLQGIYKKK